LQQQLLLQIPAHSLALLSSSAENLHSCCNLTVLLLLLLLLLLILSFMLQVM
jgi:hypothetical protein